VSGTGEPASAQDLVGAMSGFMNRLALLEIPDMDDVVAAAQAAGLAVDEVRDTRLYVGGVGDDAAKLKRQLTVAITKALGKPSGGGKHWFAGPWEVHVSVVRRIEVLLRPRYSLARLRRAAAAWLGGADLRPWLVDSGFVPADAEPDERGMWPAEKMFGPVSVAFVHTRATGDPVHVMMSMEAGVRPPGDMSVSDDERYAATLGYLAEALGAPAEGGYWWCRGSRSFCFKRMRSSSRSITFDEAEPGMVVARGFGTVPQAS